ncbi:MAG: CDP-alcohol phosphatidyltransferase family protein [Herpetosiphon sp.]
MLQTIRKAFNPQELRYPANWLSLLRICLTVPMLRFLLRSDGERKALFLIAFGMATDAVDGRIARSRGEVSELGKVLDPIADKLVLDSVAVALSMRQRLPWWVTYLLLGRDAAILTGSALMFRSSASVSASTYTGKATTAALTGSLLLYLLNIQPWGRRLLYFTLVPLLISWVQYGRRYWHWLLRRVPVKLPFDRT